MRTVTKSKPRRASSASTPERPTAGSVLRDWRERRRLSQLALALDAGISQRHLSFVESGRAQPSRELLLHLSEHLEIPLRERNRLLLAAGFAPSYPEHPLESPTLAAARSAIDRVLAGHEPFPAIAVDRHWQLVAANRAVAPLLAGAALTLLAPPVNVLRLSLHPDGIASRIVNFAQWRAHLLERLQRQAWESNDPVLAELHEELSALPAPAATTPSRQATIAEDGAGVFIPFQIATDAGVLSFVSTTTVFGTPTEVTLSEIALECFFPADEGTAAALRNPM